MVLARKRLVVFFLFFLPLCSNSNAQFINVKVKVNGLTCSACSFATQKSLQELDFIDSVDMDLNTNFALVTFKPSKKVDIDLISQKVYDAGFSVGSLTAEYTFNSFQANSHACFDYMEDAYSFVETKDTLLNGPSTLLFIGKKFMNKTELKKWKGIKPAESCKAGNGGKAYTVTIQ